MRIYTKGGDKGETSLGTGKRVPKSHLRIEACGQLDELNSNIALVCSLSAVTSVLGETLFLVQNHLFSLGAHLAAPQARYALPELKEAWVLSLEQRIDQYTKELSELKNFIIPGSQDAGTAGLHSLRSLTRRVERHCSRLPQDERGVAFSLKYLNRLSDYFFVSARFYTKAKGFKDCLWKQG